MTTLLSTWAEPGKVAIDAGWDAFVRTQDLRTALEMGLAAAEADPTLMAIGRGSLPNTDGELELDAAMMDGKDLLSGAVCAVRGILPVISVARLVMEKTAHIMLAGDQARRFALDNGFKPTNLHTAESIAKYEEWRANPAKFTDKYVHTTQDFHGDTVTMLGLQDGHAVAASSTSGLSWKMPGRVGDSPIFGAGLYADDEVGCAGATGWGEQLWKGMASFRAIEAMRAGMSAQEACDHTIRTIVRRLPLARQMACVVLALKKDGTFGAATSKDDFTLWVCRDGQVSSVEFHAVEA